MNSEPEAALNPAALADGEWAEALANAVAAGGDYHDYWTALENAAKQVRESAPELERTFALFTGIASLMLQRDKPAEPYFPAMVMSTGRTMAEEDLGDEELVFLASVVSAVEPPKLRARIGDILWRMSDSESRYKFGVIAQPALGRVV